MAHPVESNVPSIALHKTFPWGDWMDGRTWELVKGDDFSCSVEVMERSVRNYALRNGFRVQVRILNNNKLSVKRLDKE